MGRYFKDPAGVSVLIVGDVADGKYISISEDQEPVAFSPMSQNPDTKTTLIVRTERDAPEMTSTLRQVIHNLDPAVALRQNGPWRCYLGMSTFPQK